MKKSLPHLLIVALAAVGCESSPKAKQRRKPEPSVKKEAPPKLDAAILIEQAQLLRDREFTERPEVVAADDYQPPRDRFCDDRCQLERAALLEVMFGGERREVWTPPAYWDDERHAVVWDSQHDDRVALEHAVVAAIVEGLDRQAGPPIATASTWDGALARAATHRGPGVFVTFLRAASDQARGVDASALAARPEAVAQIDGSERYLRAFDTREGFALAAALYRAGGWSGVELARNRPPESSVHVVRPDRYLGGYDTGEWEWNVEATDFWTDRGLVRRHAGLVGPAVFVEWLSGHIPPSVARTAYVGWESDAYRLWRRESEWRWEWVSLWKTPSAAQQIVEALDAGFRKQGGGGRYTVLRKGATVAVLGASATLSEEELAIAPTLVTMRPAFGPGQPVGVTFVPTPTDRLMSREPTTRIEPAVWHDEIVGASIDLSLLSEEWTLTPTKEPPLPWFAKHTAGAILQWHVEPEPLLAPPFDSKGYERHLHEKFASSTAPEATIEVERRHEPREESLVVHLTEPDGTRTRAWHFTTGDYIVTVSLRATSNASFDERLAEVEKLVRSIELEPTNGASESRSGIIQFEVEE